MPSFSFGFVCAALLARPSSPAAPTPVVSSDCERIALEDLLLLVGAQELADVVAREAEGHLRQVVGAEREELALPRRSRRPSARRAALRSSCRPGSSTFMPCSFITSAATRTTTAFWSRQLLHVPDERDHDLGDDLAALPSSSSQAASKIGARLHLGDLRIGDAEAQPRWPSIGLNSCSCSTRCSSVFFSSTRLSPLPSLPAWRSSTIRSSRFGRNSCSGGSSVRIVTGRPFIALKMP